MFPQQNGLVDPMEMPFFIGLSWVMKIKADIVFKKRKSLKKKKKFGVNLSSLQMEQAKLRHRVFCQG